jgi:Ca2+-binding RTX toxin-like protein
LPTTQSPAAYTTLLQQFYLAYFGRPADTGGLAFASQALAAGNAPTTLVGLLNSSNDSAQWLIRAFGNSAESNALYGGDGLINTTALRVTAIYRNVLNRAPDAGGLAYWSGEIDAGRLSLSRVSLAIFAAGAADSNDGPLVANKTALAIAYTAAIDTTAEVNAYNGNAAAASARVLFGSVTASTNVAAFQTSIDSNLANLVQALSGVAPTPAPTPAPTAAPSPGPAPAPAPVPVPAPAPVASSFTTALDNLTGTSGADTYTALLNTAAAAIDTTFNLGDKLDASGGADVLNLTVTGNTVSTLPAVTVSNLETVNVQAQLTTTTNATTVAAGTFVGATAINADRASSAVTVTGLANGQAVGVVGNGAVINGNTSFTWGAGVTSVVLNLSGGTLGGNITEVGPAITTTTLNSTGAANVIGTLALAATSTALTINAASNFTTTGITGFAAASILTVSGAAASVSLGTLAANLNTINAGGLTAGGVTAILGNVSQVFTGGAGNDDVTNVAGASAQTGLVNAGAGTDRITFTANGQLTAASGAKFTNFEVLQSNGATDIDLNNISGITAIRTGGGATFANLTAQQAGNITVVASGALNFGVVGAATPGQNDVVSLTTRDAVVAIATLTLPSVETINLTASTGSALTSITSLAHAQWTALNLSGASNITITSSATAAVANSVINGAAATGVLTLNFAATTTNGLTITGGSGNDVLTGTGLVDVIRGGLGNDNITGGTGDNFLYGEAGDDTLTGGTGNELLDGGDGNDALNGAAGNNTLLGGAGTDTLTTLTVTVGNNILQGGADADSLTGGNFLDSLTGETGTVASGGALFTALTGNTEADTLTGGLGNDVYGIGAGSTPLVFDTIVGLNFGTAVVAGQVDRIVIDAPMAAASAAAVRPLTTGEQTTVTAALNLTAATNAVAAIVTGVNNVTTFTFGPGPNIYLFANGSAATTVYTAAEDALVLITGVTGTLDVSDVVFI